jgi:hypothetical protein
MRRSSNMRGTPIERRFRNFMNFDRTWCEDVGSEDSNGRAIWALGVTARDARAQKHRDWASVLFDDTASIALELEAAAQPRLRDARAPPR